MVQIEQHEKGYIIGGVAVIGAEAPGKITLATSKWPAMNYGIHDLKKVDFPGEYDINWVAIECFEADGVLSYLLRIDDKLVALLQNSAILEVANFDSVDEWICANEDIKEELESLELEGDIMVLWVEGVTKSVQPVEKKKSKNVR